MRIYELHALYKLLNDTSKQRTLSRAHKRTNARRREKYSSRDLSIFLSARVKTSHSVPFVAFQETILTSFFFRICTIDNLGNEYIPRLLYYYKATTISMITYRLMYSVAVLSTLTFVKC